NSPASKQVVLLQLGSWYRFGDSVIGLVGLEYANLRVAFSADYNTQSFNPRNTVQGDDLSSFEVSLSILLETQNTFKSVTNPIY
ncbi:MAG: type IX secretion system membrane protein PorP/SprF, partial [Bacteroidota bacterium]